MAVVELPTLPGLAGSYLAGLRPRRGESLPDTELRVPSVPTGGPRLARYQRICGFDVSDTLPATYPHVLAFPLLLALMTAPGFPFPLPGLVHVANEITRYRPLVAGEPLALSVRAERLAPHRRGTTVDLVLAATVDDRPVWTERGTYLHRGRGTDLPRESRPEPPEPAAYWHLPRDLGRRYGAVSGDRNPIHLSRLTCWPFGYRRPIAHGMWTLARCLAALGPRLPDAYTVEARFTRPAPLGARVGFGADTTGFGWQFAVRRHAEILVFGQVRAA